MSSSIQQNETTDGDAMFAAFGQKQDILPPAPLAIKLATIAVPDFGPTPFFSAEEDEYPGFGSGDLAGYTFDFVVPKASGLVIKTMPDTTYLARRAQIVVEQAAAVLAVVAAHEHELATRVERYKQERKERELVNPRIRKGRPPPGQGPGPGHYPRKKKA